MVLKFDCSDAKRSTDLFYKALFLGSCVQFRLKNVSLLTFILHSKFKIIFSSTTKSVITVSLKS